ncbi:MAG TPA: hypothetical protein VFX70_02185 [Mycobacteriales bacterium]|nr:hypothetical protein [Mycobacteriales bacterium]
MSATFDRLRLEYDSETLREMVRVPDELRAARAELTAELDGVDENTDPAGVARLAGQRATVSRALGDLDLALADAERALAAAERTGNLRVLTVTRIRLAHVHQWREEFTDSNALFALCMADLARLPDTLRSFVHQHAGKNFYDQRRYAEAAEQFAEALRLREGGDPELVESSRLGLKAAREHLEQAS